MCSGSVRFLGCARVRLGHVVECSRDGFGSNNISFPAEGFDGILRDDTIFSKVLDSFTIISKLT